jgi:hypothetical protein
MGRQWIGLGSVVALLALAACGDEKPAAPDGSQGRASPAPGQVVTSAAARQPVTVPNAANGAGADRATEEVQQVPLPARPIPKVGDIVPNDWAPLEGGWSHTGSGLCGLEGDDCGVDHYDQLEPGGPNIGHSLYVVTQVAERAASGGISKGRVTLVFYARLTELESKFCSIGGRPAVVAFADHNWQNGTAYITDGKTLQIRRWRDKAPPDCPPPEDPEERD